MLASISAGVAGIILFFRLPTYNANRCWWVWHRQEVDIWEDRFEPKNIAAGKCDELVFVNKDRGLHMLAFGVHTRHTPYGDFTQRLFNPGEQIGIVLSESGSFIFHDHINDDLQGNLTVK